MSWVASGFIETQWNESSNLKFSHSEWFILTKIYEEEERITISYVTKQVDISRQAVHKSVQRLKDKGLVIVKKHDTNKRERLIELTKLGEQCLKKNTALKAELERKIVDHLSMETVQQLQDILMSDWGLSDDEL